MKTKKHQLIESTAATLCGILAAAIVLTAAPALADTESGISTTGTNGLPSACLESDLLALLRDCIARNQTNPPPGNPGPFTRGYKEFIFLGGQCNSGGFASLTNLGDNVIVGASADARTNAHAGIRILMTGTNVTGQKDVMVWVDILNDVIRQASNAPLAAILDFVRANNPDTNAMTPPPAVSPGGDSIVLGDPMNNLQPGTSFHAVLFGGYSDIAGKTNGQVTKEQWQLKIASGNGTKDMNRTLQESLHVPKTNILIRNAGTYAELGAMITNVWASMNDNEQFLLFIADHGSRHCRKTNVAPRPGGNGFSVSFATEPYLKSPPVRMPTVGLQTSFVGAPGEVRFNQHTIGLLPVNGPAYCEYVFNPNLIQPVGSNNTVEVVVPQSNVGVEWVDLFTGPVLGSDFPSGFDPTGAAINVCNATGSNKTDFHAVYEGRLSSNVVTRARRTLADGTPIADWAVGGTTISYDPTNNVTTVSWMDAGNPITNGGYASFSVVESNRPVLSLLYSWSPASPGPDDDLAPVNLKSIRSVTTSNLELAVLSAPLLTRTQILDWSVAFANNRIPADQFYFNDPAVTSLPVSSTQTMVLDPEISQVATVTLPSLPSDAPLPTAVVHSWERWANGVPPNNVSRITQIPMLADADTTRTTNCPGSGTFFTVNVAGGSFKWYKNGVLLPGETSDTLTLLNLAKSDAGIYTCIGTNLIEIKRKFFLLFIRDFVLPLINCPGDITVTATSSSGAVVNYASSISASDSCGVIDGSTFTCSPPPGSLFPIGTTEVTCSVSDTFGNVGRCRFNITVLPVGADIGIYPNRTYMVLRWADTNAELQCAPAVTGPWPAMAGATSPYTVTPLQGEQYFRLLISGF